MKGKIKRAWYDNGQLHYETPYNKNGKWCGIHKMWSYNGLLWCKTQMKNDLEHGTRVIFFY